MIWDNILIDPRSKEKLIIDAENLIIKNLNTELFNGQIIDEIPIILPNQIDQNLKVTDLHHKTNSQFDYLNHYKIDAQEFDYFLQYDSPITNDEINRLHQKIVSRIPKSANLFLDVGCGNGWLSKQIVDKERKVISMDISLINPRKALKNFKHQNHFGLVADVFNLPIQDNSMDCIVASEIIEHVPNPKLFIDKLLKALKKGGKIIITTPYNEKIEYHLCVHCNKPTPVNAHLHSFNEKNIKQLIPENISKWEYSTFANKYVAKLRLYLLIKNWPFKIWERIDAMLNKIIKSPTRLMIEIEK